MRSMQEDNEAELISKVLYPSDNHFEGKSLRLKQQYFLEIENFKVAKRCICEELLNRGYNVIAVARRIPDFKSENALNSRLQ